MLAANQLMFMIREYGINYIGGWHSVMETEIFRIALDRRNDPNAIRSLTLFTARGMEHESWEGFLADRFGPKGPFTGFPEKEEYFRRAGNGQLLVLSITEPSVKKMTRGNIAGRNLTACALADVVFIPFAERGTKTYTLVKRALGLGVPVFTAECAENKDLVELGVPTLTRKDISAFLENLGASKDAKPAFTSAGQAGARPLTLEEPSATDPKAMQYTLFVRE